LVSLILEDKDKYNFRCKIIIFITKRAKLLGSDWVLRDLFIFYQGGGASGFCKATRIKTLS
jgi:hypothetical protein